MTETKQLQSIKNEINSLSEKFVQNTVSLDDVNNTLDDKLSEVIKLLKSINDKLDN